jgi:FKBP-type peptidyl-prolyl cis-trans isomerase SlyD
MNPQVISFHYTLTSPTGEMLDTSQGAEPLTFMSGIAQIIPGLEAGLLGLKVGEKKKIQVPAAQAYGLHDEKMVMSVARSKFPKMEIKIGDHFQAGNDPEAPPLKVIGVTDTEVKLDANHPLAGVDLTFDIEIVTVRDATQEELTHKHAHGPGGHDH